MTALRRIAWIGTIAASLLTPVAASGESSPATAAARFFFSGDGVLHLYHAHFGIERTFHFRRADGSYDVEELGALRQFFRSRTDDEQGPLSLRLVELLDYVEDRFRPRRLTLYSAYRSPAFNAQLPGAARASLHTQGLAADIGVEGHAVRKVWEDLRERGMGGVGLYPGDEVLHIDAGPARFWAASTSRVGEDLSAGNARMFVRTEFDRYASLDGARIAVHSVTAFPLGFRRHVGSAFELVAEDAHVVAEGDCLWIRDPAPEHRLRLRARQGEVVDVSASQVVLSTCAPRIERTPENVESNRIEMYHQPPPGNVEAATPQP